MNFSNPENTKMLWEKIILPRWRHSTQPVKKRFLGSLSITKKDSNHLLSIVGRNLRSHLKSGQKLTYKSLSERFDINQNWVKIITVALSEYAYYYSSSDQGFWDGFCRHELIKVSHSQGVEMAFRDIIRKGIELLGLVKAEHGYTYVSTLWLQSGIPQKNLHHFAELVQDCATNYGWWELAHTSEKLLSQELLDFCQERHLKRNWSTLIGFLKISCSDTEQVEPISGQLVQGIATVALELERNNQSADILRDVNLRENLLRNYDLPKHFFLRDWDNLIQVLSRVESNNSNHHRRIRFRKKPLSLILDIFNTGNIQLILPEQHLKEVSWSSLPRPYCCIHTSFLGTIWEGSIPSSSSDFLKIPERIIDLRSMENQWDFRLLSHDKRELVAWHYEGITEALPCLIFDANLGTHIPLDVANPLISKTDEIICFVPNDISLTLNDGIDILDSYVPCSISGWYGQHIQLLSQQSEIHLNRAIKPLSKAIAWQLLDNQLPVLRGLKIKGKKEIYLETPTLWHPPTSQNLSFTISVENLTMIARESVDILNSDRWQKISLKEMITTSSKYQVRFWNAEHRYSFGFELRSEYQIPEISNPNTLQISRAQGEIVERLPVQCNQSDKFWSEVISFKGLWTLEKVAITLSNGDSKTSCLVHADRSGSASISLSTLYGKFQSDWYCLSYQRSGLGEERLVELVATEPISYTWDREAIHLSGLHPHQNYSLICWNLLNPNQVPERIRIEQQGQDTIAVPLTLGVGIYHIQIQGRSIQDLGCWCGSNRTDLPDLVEEDADLENYCYTILDNESIENFVAASEVLGIDRQRVKSMVSSLQTNSYKFHFPDWLNRESLLEKLEAFLTISHPTEPILPTPPPLPIRRNWHLIHVTPYKRETFHTLLKNKLHSNEFRDLILEIGVPQDSVYRDLMLVRSPNFKNVRSILSQIAGFQKIEPKPLTTDQVNRMLGRN